MKILTNEYASNVAQLPKSAKGGPANFARLFYNYLNQDRGAHQWQGLLVNFDDTLTQSSLRKIVSFNHNKYFYHLKIPHNLSKLLTRARRADINPRETLAEPITKLVKLIAKLNPDIIFLNGFSLGNWILLEAAHQAGRKIVIQHAGIWAAELDTYQHFFTKSGIQILKQMELESATLSSAEIFLNNFSRNYFDQAHPSLQRPTAHQVAIIPLAVDFKLYQGANIDKNLFPYRAELFKIGVVARWDRIKNHQAVLDLALQIKSRQLPWLVNAVTTIPITKKFLRFKQKYRDHISLVNNLSKEGIASFCSANDLIIIPSKFDVSPTILLEAIATGTPVAISPSVGFVDDYRKFGADDWIIDFDHSTKALQQLKKLRGKVMPRQLIKHLIAKHEAENVFGQYLKLFNKLTT